MSGASGMRYALRLIEVLEAHSIELHVVISEAGVRVLHEEEELKVSSSAGTATQLIGRESSKIIFYPPKDIGAAIASGSFRCDGMVVCPCSMGTVGSIANGISSNLLQRAAEVTLKESRPLILIPRETPLSAIHLSNLSKLSLAGVKIVPAMPGFYHRPTTIEELIDMMVMKITDAMGLDIALVPRWKDAK